MWKIAVYLRLSRDDGDKSESDSIQNQRQFINSFIALNIEDVDCISEYVDDGYTGTNFQRPDFKRMMNDVDNNKINCVIVKDLSRFGRDYIGVGEYLEKYFPNNDIRFIAINDNYDTEYQSTDYDFIMPIKNIFNANYSKDISKKVRSSFRTLQTDGKFIGAFAKYGYMKDPNDKHKLIVDDNAAQVVKMIFQWYLEGFGKQSIARKLNALNIPCPAEYKKLNGMNYTNGNRISSTKYWTYSSVNIILKDEMYTGTMVQNKSVRKTIHGKAKKNDEDNWIKKENTHEAIIEKDKWKLVQELLTKNTRQLDFEQNVGIFAGYMFCKDCGRAMSKITRNNKIYYVCGTYKRYGKGICSSHNIEQKILEESIIDKLNQEIKKAEYLDIKIQETEIQKTDTKKYEIMLSKLYNLKKSIYEDYKSGILTKDEYIAYKDDYTKEEEMIKGQINIHKQNSNKIDAIKNEWVENLIKHKEIKELDREVVAEVLDKILVSENDKEISVEIILKVEL